MGNIINDIVDEVEIKPHKSKLIIKWIISISISLIMAAFIFGQLKSSYVHRIDNIENSLNSNTLAIKQLGNKLDSNFSVINGRINKIYDDGLTAFNTYQEYNKKQLGLIIDYGSTNKDLLKRMLEINAMQSDINLKANIESSKNKNINLPHTTIEVKSLIKKDQTKDYISLEFLIGMNKNDTIFRLTGATKEYINNIDTNKYEIGVIIPNSSNSSLFDVSYRNKK